MNRTWRIDERPAKIKIDPKIEALVGIAPIPPSWIECRLNDIAQLINGRAYAQPELLAVGTPVIRIQNLNGGTDWYYSDLTLPERQYCTDGDLLFAWSASFGPYIWNGSKAIFHYHIWKLNLSAALDKRFFYFSLLHITDVVREQSHGLAMLHMTKGQMERWPVLLPPLAEQKRIVAKLDELMILIDDLEAKQTKKREVGARLTKFALGALTSADGPEEFDAAWKRVVENFGVLIDRAEKVADLRTSIFGLACRGVLTRRKSGSGADVLKQIGERRQGWADEQHAFGNREAARHVAKLTEQSTNLPALPIPREWAWTTLLAASWQLMDCHNKTAPYTSSGMMLVRTSNVREGKVNLDGVKYVTKETYEHWSRRCPPAPGDVLFTREAPMGEVGLIQQGMKVCMGQRMMLLRVFPDLLDPRYLVLALRDAAFQARMTGAAVGSTVKHLRVGDVEGLFVPLPPAAEQKAIVSKVDSLMKICDELEVKLRRAEERAAKLAEAAVRELVV
jgi:type I restriction enzyme S subunit